MAPVADCLKPKVTSKVKTTAEGRVRIKVEERQHID